MFRIILYYIIAAMSTCLISVNNAPVATKDVEFIVCSNDFHTSICVSKKLLQKTKYSNYLDVFRFCAHDSDFPYLQFNLGERDFYLQVENEKDLTFSLIFQALFIPDTSLLYVSNFDPEKSSQKIRRVRTSKGGFEKMMEYIDQSFQKDSNQNYLCINPVKWMPDCGKFFESSIIYSFINTCNNWTNTAIKKSGVKTSLWTPFSFGVLFFLSKGN